jgi:tripartite-type tricarboxylate transporter receptor subunit TctC
MFRRVAIGCSIAMLALGTLQADENFPSRAVRIIDAYSAGGSSDIAMRLLTDAFGRASGKLPTSRTSRAQAASSAQRRFRIRPRMDTTL